MLNKIHSNQISEHLKGGIDCFICYTSFEERCLVVAKAIDGSGVKRAFVLQNQPAANETERQTTQLNELFGSKAEFVSVRIGQPLYTVDQFTAKIIPAIKSAAGNVLIDITTFTHEHLLILLYLLNSEKLIGKAIFAYSGAGDYSPNTPLSDIWLTKGVKQVRSVVGYPGALVPSKDLHLIVMVGFEHERAQRVIETYEPARLSLGFAPPLASVSENLSETNKEFFLRVQQFAKETKQGTMDLGEFEFSCIDPIQARDALLKQIGQDNDYNTVVCPLNTKIATIGAALTAFERDDIQLCYAEAAIYNSANYSSPGSTITLFDLPETKICTVPVLVA